MIQFREVGGKRKRLVALPRNTQKALDAWNAFTRSDSVFGLDVESTAFEELGTYDPSIRMRLIQFGNRRECWALDPHDPKWRARVHSFLCDPTKRFVSHNAAFDTTRVLFEFGVKLGDRSIDTLVMAALLYPGQTHPGGKGLKALCDAHIDGALSEADRLLHARMYDLYFAQKPRKTRLLPLSFEPGVSVCRRPKGKGEKCQQASWPGSECGYCEEHWLARGESSNKEAEAWGWEFIPLDDPYFITYAGLDALYCRLLLDILARLLGERKMNRLSRTEQRVKRLMTDISVKGHRVDAEWTKPILDEVEAEFEEAQERVEILTHGIKARSPYLKRWFEEHGVRVKSLDKDHLPGLIEKYGHGTMGDPEVGDVLEQLEVVSANSNLLSNLRTIWLHATEGDGFTHANCNTQQAHTGRQSWTGPAMQTFAKKGEKGTRLRGCYIAREGHVLVGADYDSQETRLAAGYSRDAVLLRVVLEGLNQHNLTAEGLFDDWTNKAEQPDHYAKAKTLNYAQQYGAMPRKIAATLGISVREATVLWQKWRHTYAGLVSWSDEQASKREVRNVFGRLIPRDPFREYANGNYMIQSTGRDVLGAALCRLADAGWADTFWLPMHDEMTLEVPEDRADEAADALTEHMSTEVLGISIPAEGEVIGTRWRGLG